MGNSLCTSEFWYSWRYQLPALAQVGQERQGHRGVALVLRGYNLSNKPVSGYEMATLADDLRGTILALGEQKADIIGHDWGVLGSRN